MMPVALPSIIEQYGVGLSSGVWVISIYVLLVAVLMPIFGWLGDRYGYRRIYTVGLAGMVLFSWGAALAPSFGWLLVFRVLQGIFNATTLPSVMGIISQVFPSRERGVAMGAWATVNGAGHGLGPVISGFLVQRFSWPATFWLNGATALLAVVLVPSVVPSDRKHDSRPFDLLGAGALTFAMLTLMFNLSEGKNLGWGSLISLSLWGAFAALMLLFVVREKRVSHPFVELRLFGNKRYRAVAAIASAQFFSLMGLQILLPLYLIQLRGFATGLAGLLVAPLASTMAICSPVAGRTADRLSYRITIIGGMAVVTLAAASMAFWDVVTPPWIIVVTLVVIGLGMGFTQSPAATGVTLVVREDELGVALGIFNMLRFVSGTFGATAFGIILETARLNGSNPLGPFHLSFYVLTAVVAVAVLLAISMPHPPEVATVRVEA
jgi:EmrB/QacA subfamily drug resistance transporter